METRYMLPIEVLAYMLVLAPGWPHPVGPREVGWKRFRTLAILVLAGLVFTAVIWDTVSGIHTYFAHPL